jgi:hypothetical protein
MPGFAAFLEEMETLVFIFILLGLFIYPKIANTLCDLTIRSIKRCTVITLPGPLSTWSLPIGNPGWYQDLKSQITSHQMELLQIETSGGTLRVSTINILLFHLGL